MKKKMALGAGYLVRRTSVFQNQPHAGDAVLGGHVVGAPSGVPARILQVKESGRGKNRITRYLVEVDYAGRTWLAWIDPDNFTETKQNPRRRAKRRTRKNPKRRARPLVRNYPGGQVRTITKRQRKARVRRAARQSLAASQGFDPLKIPGVSLRDYPRGHFAKKKRRRVRVNPAAARRSFVVKVAASKRGALHEQARFRSKPVALNYARALAKANPRATVAVYKS